MNEHTEKTFQAFESSQSEAYDEERNEKVDMTNLQDKTANKSGHASDADKVSDITDEAGDDENNNAETGGMNEGDTMQEPSWEEKYVALNDSYLRLIAEFDNFRKRTLREKADLIKSGGATVLANMLPVIDDFERAMTMLQTTDDLTSAVEGVKLIYEKFVNYLSQQGVKAIETKDQPFDTDFFEAIATFPVPENDRKGLVIDCVQTGYKLYDKVLRHAKVVVGE